MQMLPSYSSIRVPIAVCIILFCVSMTTVSSMPNYALACDRREVKTSCLYGCLGCLEAYGPQMYNMAACCHDCKTTQAVLIDDGPIKCSGRYIHTTWLKRFGKRDDEPDREIHDTEMSYGFDDEDSIFFSGVYK